MDRGTWYAAVHGVTKSWTRLSNFTFPFHFHALEKEMATNSNVLAWRIPGMAEPGGLLSMGSHRVGHDWSDSAAAAVSQETDGPQAGQMEFVHCGEILKKSRREEKLSPAQIRHKRPPIPHSWSQGDLPDYTYTVKFPGGQKGGASIHRKRYQAILWASSLESILAKTCTYTYQRMLR